MEGRLVRIHGANDALEQTLNLNDVAFQILVRVHAALSMRENENNDVINLNQLQALDVPN